MAQIKPQAKNWVRANDHIFPLKRHEKLVGGH